MTFNNANPFTANGAPLVTGNALTTSFGSTPSVTGHDTGDGERRRDPNAGRTQPDGHFGRVRDIHRRRRISDSNRRDVPNDERRAAVGQCAPSIAFKKFGISLNFTPVVLTEGRISLRVMTEVSEVSSDNSINISGLIVPSIKTRRAETTLEIPSGGAMAMAGLIQDQTKQAINGLPGLSTLPVLGTLFRSRDFINNQTELMVIVTPFIVRAVAQKDLSRPDDGFAAASDPQADLLGSINRIYGVPGRVEPAQNYRGTYGFITD